jgi:hypothetical protein
VVRNILVRVSVFVVVLALSFAPFGALGYMGWLVPGGETWTEIVREVVQSAELLVIATGLVAGAAGDLVLSTLRQESAGGKFTSAVLANFTLAMAFLLCASVLYARIALSRRVGGPHVPAEWIVYGFAFSILMVINTMWLGEVRDAEQNKVWRSRPMAAQAPSVWRTRVHRVLWGQTPGSLSPRQVADHDLLR